jgi:hypothetical protein
MLKLNSLAIAFLLLFTVNWLPSRADDSAAPPETPASPGVLKGGVRGAALLTEDGLVKMGEAVQEIRQASSGLMNEVTRKDTVVVRGPNVISGNIIIPALPNPSGTIQFGNLPPRKKQMQYLMGRLAHMVQLLQNEMDALIIPDDKMDAVSEKWNQMRTTMEGVQSSLAELNVLTENERNYDNLKIGKRALYIFEKIGTLNNLRRDVLKTIKTN